VCCDEISIPPHFEAFNDITKAVVFKTALWRSDNEPYGLAAHPIPERFITRAGCRSAARVSKRLWLRANCVPTLKKWQGLALSYYQLVQGLGLAPNTFATHTDR
jgi:hypothetical protein